MVESHPTWVRGLKHPRWLPVKQERPSHPTWVRGLKQQGNGIWRPIDGVAPYVGAWIETPLLAPVQFAIGSHPTWVRGLKQILRQSAAIAERVAPYVGAWIETTIHCATPCFVNSRTLRGCVD